MGFFLEIRGLVVMTDMTVQLAPVKLSAAGPGPELARWMQKNKATYYLHRPPVNPWRVWQFRTPRLQEWVTGKPVGKVNPWFELYELADGQLPAGPGA